MSTLSTRKKSTLFLLEQLIVIAVFALCAVACISILTSSYYMATDAGAAAEALIAAQNYAELHKAAGRNTETETVYFDKHWQPAGDAQNAEFVLRLEDGIVSVKRISGESLIDLTVKISGREQG